MQQDPNMSYTVDQTESITARWNLSFDTYNDPVEFLEQLDELMSSGEVKPDKVLKVLPRFLKGKAVLWYRNNKNSFTTWNEFIELFKLTFVSCDSDLLAKIVNYRQHHRQKFTDYLIEIQTLMRRYAKMSKEEELNRIYENMNAKYKFYIKKSEVDSISKLIQLANDYENVTAERQTSFTEREPRNDHHETSTNQGHKETASYIHNYNTNTCCWSCGKQGHSMKDCRSKKVLFCNGCGKIGKMSKQCCKKTSEYTQSMTINTSPQIKDNRPFVDVSILGEKYQALVDTGATRSYINDQVYKKFAKNIKHS
ncbi:uncharacterized protein LOC135087350 [Ostrinia nubilalis]|uniref:uncharacterized protein LOC135087350 n=1 Tax=Ostrinia nubilalis TaxID=29057 RepID=UPI00308252CF